MVVCNWTKQHKTLQ